MPHAKGKGRGGLLILWVLGGLGARQIPESAATMQLISRESRQWIQIAGVVREFVRARTESLFGVWLGFLISIRALFAKIREQPHRSGSVLQGMNPTQANRR